MSKTKIKEGRLEIANSATITTTVSITSQTLTDTGLSQAGKVIKIDNGVNAINYTVNGITASFVKGGTGSITFVQGVGRTLISSNGLIWDMPINSRATIASFGTVDYLYIDKAISTINPLTFLDLTDTPTTYTGQAGKSVIVNSAEDGVEFKSKQDTLVSATNIKTINGTSVLGSGNIVVSSVMPSLDEVLTVGNTSNKSIIIDHTSNYIEVKNSTTSFSKVEPNGFITCAGGSDGLQAAVLIQGSNGSMSFYSNNNAVITMLKQQGSKAGTWYVQLPAVSSKTLVASVNGFYADDYGNVKLNVTVPSTATSTGVAGQYAYDTNYFYVCIATNTWKRTALVTW